MRLGFRFLLLVSFMTISWPYPAWAESVARNSRIQYSSGADAKSGEGNDAIGFLTLDHALALAFSKNPDLLASSFEIKAREARILQARVIPNPEIEVQIEDIYGNKELRQFDGAETTLSLSQLIELAGKRPKRTELASIDQGLAKWDYRSRKSDLQAEVTKAFVDVLNEQERVALLQELLHIAEQSLATVAARVQAGKVSPIDGVKAKATFSLVKIEFERAKQSLAATRNRLAAFWGGDGGTWLKVQGKLDLDSSIPLLEELRNLIGNNPDLARWEVEIKQRNASLNLEKAKRIPDPSIRGGVRYFNGTNETTFLFGVSVPLPLFNRNRGAVLEAERRFVKGEEERRVAMIRAQTALSDAYRTMANSFLEANTLKDSVLPSLQSVYDATLEGYRYGKFGYLDVLDAQRTLFESKGRYIENLAAYQKSKTDVHRLIGFSLENQPKEGSKDEK